MRLRGIATPLYTAHPRPEGQVAYLPVLSVSQTKVAVPPYISLSSVRRDSSGMAARAGSQVLSPDPPVYYL